MRIGGFQPLTVSDYPGCVAAIVFTQGCNFRCPFCHNGDLLQSVPDNSLLDDNRLLELLCERKNILDGIVISGGEPTIQEDLPVFIDKCRQMDLKIKLDTNGSRPDMIRLLLTEQTLDYIAMDIKAPLSKYSLLSGIDCPIDKINESIEIIANSRVTSEFRTTFVPGLLTQNDIDSIRLVIPERSKYTMQRFIPENALDLVLRNNGDLSGNCVLEGE
jgi:pyruvate formate lyase activating enzyme